MWAELRTILRAFFFHGLIALALVTNQTTAQPLTGEWSFDILRLKNGAVFKGLVLEETGAQIRFQKISRLPGRPTTWITVTLGRQEIDRVEKLPDADRAVLKSRLQELDPKGEGERKRMEQLDLKIVQWNGKPALLYDSDHFSLCSNAPEEIVRRCAVRLEEVYTAYARFLPPRCKGAGPTMILLAPTLKDYEKILADRGRKLQNPAFYEPGANRIFCGSDVLTLGNDLAKIRSANEELRKELDRKEAELRELYRKKDPKELAQKLEPYELTRKAMARQNRHNEEIFQKETQQLFTILYHEAFHAYVTNFVYPPAKGKANGSTPGELPHWLNEGLAQIFETAMVEAGELRIEQADKDKLARAKEAVAGKKLVPLKDILKSGVKEFIVVHNGDRLGSDQAYLTSWALTSYLALDRRLLGTAALDEYVRAVNQGGNIEEAFSKMVGQDLGAFERDFHLWISRLRPDGSLANIKGK